MSQTQANDAETVRGAIGKRDHEVIVVGGGPTGLMLAGELALAGVDVAIIERRESQHLAGMRAGGLHMRTMEILDQRGIGDRFAAIGERHPFAHFHGALLDLTDFPTRRNYFVTLPQNHIERLLAEWVGELGVPVYRGRDVVGITQEADEVAVKTAGGQTLTADYVVGCDGARSAVRKASGIAFVGTEPTKSWLIAEAEWTQEPEWGFRQGPDGTYALGKMEDPGLVRIVLTEAELSDGRDPSLDEVKTLLIAIYGSDFGIRNPVWISRFTDRCRQAAAYRDRRVLLAGDAAHMHPPQGGQGLNIGVQDAVNLGWKLAQVVKGSSSHALLDTYHAERHPVGARVLLNAMADVALQRPDERTKAAVALVSEFAMMDGPRRQIVGERSGLSVHYDLGQGDPLLGRRMPDLDLETDAGAATAFDFLHQARPVLFEFADGRTDLTGWSDRVERVTATASAKWELPVLGVVDAPAAVLVRPDGHVAWTGDSRGEGLASALTLWCGEPGLGTSA